jgi:hypothetical protein
MKKLIPAVFFQKQLNGVEAPAKKPQVLELYEHEMQKIVGGRSPLLSAARTSVSGLRYTDPDGPPDGSGGITTYSGSEGWADVAQADDCASL